VPPLLGRDYISTDRALAFAAYGGHDAIMRLLLERIVIGPESRDEALRMARKDEHEVVVRLLCKYSISYTDLYKVL
jgi:hypothetical protein